MLPISGGCVKSREVRRCPDGSRHTVFIDGWSYSQIGNSTCLNIASDFFRKDPVTYNVHANHTRDIVSLSSDAHSR